MKKRNALSAGVYVFLILCALFTLAPLILALINSFKVFREAYLVAGRYPNSSIYMLQHVLSNWFSNWDMQKISAAAVLLMCVGRFHAHHVANLGPIVTLQAELAQPMPWLEFVATKKAMSKFSAKNYSRLAVDDLTRQAVTRALAKDSSAVPLYSFEAPITLNIEFNHSSMADQAALMPYTKRLDGRSLEFTADNYEIVFETIMVLVYLASSTHM